MAGILLSGPAGGGKSQLSRDLIREATEPTVQADFQSIVVALLGHVRRPDGTFPVRPTWVLPLAEYVRQAVITGAESREIFTIITNSDGDPLRRAALLDRLGAGSVERIIDPGESVVRARLADAVTGVLSDDCNEAVNRWYGRVNRG